MLDGELVLLCSSLWACGLCRYSEFLVWVEESGTLSSSEVTVVSSGSLVPRVWWALLWLGGALDLRTDQLVMLVAMQDGDAGRQCRTAMQVSDAGRGCRTAMQDGELVLLCSSLWACGSCRYSAFLVWVAEGAGM